MVSKQKNPLISVIIPAYNEERYILKTIKSLAKQDFKEFETIIVLSACTDRTEQVVSHYMKLHPKQKISLVVEQNIGVSKARNKGAKFARGNLFVFVDADTHLESSCLSKIHKYMTSDYSIATCHSKPDPWSFLLSLIVGIKNMLHRLKFIKGVHGTIICWRGHFEKVEGFNEELVVMEHRDIIKRLLALGRYKWIPTAYVKTSMRRWVQKGITKTCLFWIQQGIKQLQGKDVAKEYEAIR